MKSPASTAMTAEQKRRLLSQLLGDQLGEQPAGQPRTRVRLSLGQQAMWFMHQLTPDTAAYNLGDALRLHGPVHLPAARRAVTRLAERHPILCTRIVSDGDGLWQEQLSTDVLRLTEVDAAGWSDSELTAHLARELDRPFDLTAGPLVRIALYRRSGEEHVALLTLHHIVGEFWTYVILISDLLALYVSEVTGAAAGLPVLATTYADFTEWQRKMLDGPDGERLISHWKHTLGGTLPTLELPADRPRPPVQTFNGALFGFDIDAATSRRVRAVARDNAVTVYQALLAAFAVFLQRHSGQREVLIGSPMTGRVDPRWAHVVGYFDNPLPIRVPLIPGTTFRQLIRQVRGSTIEAFEHQSLPLPLLVQRLGVRPDPGSSPLFNVMFVLRRTLQPQMSGLATMAMGGAGTVMALGPDLSAESLELPRRFSQFDLTLSMAETDSVLRAGFEYSTDLFERETIGRFADRFATLLGGLVENPDAPVSRAPILSARERTQVLQAWNATDGPLPADPRLHAGFEAAAVRTPDAEAVVDADRRLTYRQLDDWSDTLAAELQRSGSVPGRLVAVCMRKGAEQVVAALAVCKSGAAYLPVDPDLPPERAAELIRIGEARHILVQPGTVPNLPAKFTGEILSVRPDVTSRVERPDRLPADPRRIAYVIFTSGSTGTPKGVVIDHLGALNTIEDINRRFGVGPADRVLALSSFSFDLSVYDIFGTLAAGGTIVIPPAAAAKDPARCLELVRKEQVTVWNSVPALAQLAVEEAERDGGGLAGVRLALLSGDWVPLGLPGKLHAASPEMRVVSLGGATEASIWSIWHEVGDVDPSWTSIPYGRPLANQRFYVLDGTLEPCPPTVAGELWIGGAGLAHGYWRDQQRTQQSFVDHPQLGRLYRTGDLGRFRRDGTIEFLGREDHQVKVRGFRVELGEIETVLTAHSRVREGVVVAVGDRGARRLVAFVVPASAFLLQAGRGRLLAADVRRYCQRRLPDYMVPPVVLPVAELPLTGNGKVDRARLAGLAAHAASHPEPHAAGEPADERQRLVCSLIGDILGIAVGPGDDFLDLGGDSVAAIRLCAAARRRGLSLQPAQVLAERTATAIAAVAAVADAPPLARVHGSAPARRRLSPMQQTMLLHATVAGIPELYCEQVRVAMSGPLDVVVLARAWEEVLDRHEALRARFDFDARGQPFQWFERRTAPAMLRVVDLRALAAGDREQALSRIRSDDTRIGLPDPRRPLSRWTVVHLADDRHELLWTHHHILLDGWSITLVLRDLISCYDSLVAGNPPMLPPAVPYSRFLDWLDAVDTARRAEDEPFWRRELAGMKGGCVLPEVRRPGAAPFRHGEVEVRLDAESETLRAGARHLGVTLNTLVQTAWALLLSRWTGEDDVTFGVTTSGRPPEFDGSVEEIVGLFINTMPLRVPVAPDSTVRSALLDVQLRQQRLLAHETGLLADVERWSGCPRRAGRTALFDTIVVFENYLAPEFMTATKASLAVDDISFSEVTGARLMLYVLPEPHIVLRLCYDASRHDRREASRIVDDLRAVLLRLAEDPERPLRAVPTLPAARIDEAVLDGGPLPGAVPSTVNRILEHVKRRPGAIAVEEGRRQLRRDQLAMLAAELAGRMCAAGVAAGDLVAILLPRGADAVVAILATLFAGAGYVPLDPDGPAERTREVLADVRPRLLLTTAAQVEGWDVGELPPIVRLDDPAEQPGGRAPGTVAAPPPGGVAYVIHTSGSTGRPNGVAVPHAALDHFVAAAAARYGITEQDRVLQFAPLHFDTSVEEIFVALATGATLVIRTDGMTGSVPRFLAECRSLRISVLDLPTAYWHEIAYALGGSTALPRSVRMVIVGGEAVLPERLARWHAAVDPAVRLLNTYGPTEVTVAATVAELDAADCAVSLEDHVSIGSPLPGVVGVVLDRHGQLAAAGTIGELHLAGPTLACGYLGRPELDADRFLRVDVLAGGLRAYRTGDLVRRRADGQLVFVGRRDDEFKISGLRVDPAEVEAVLATHPSVAGCGVVGSILSDGTRRLSAYVVGASPTPPVAELRAHLAARLPPAAVPAVISFVDSLPQISSGKIDRAALRRYQPADDLEPAARPPATAAERLVLAVWEQVLGHPCRSVLDEFFELGGQSLQTIQVANRLGVELGEDVPITLLLRYPVAADFAAALDREFGRAVALKCADPPLSRTPGG
jgi:amino acid adenylation domain-containing protein